MPIQVLENAQLNSVSLLEFVHTLHMISHKVLKYIADHNNYEKLSIYILIFSCKSCKKVSGRNFFVEKSGVNSWLRGSTLFLWRLLSAEEKCPHLRGEEEERLKNEKNQ